MNPKALLEAAASEAQLQHRRDLRQKRKVKKRRAR